MVDEEELLTQALRKLAGRLVAGGGVIESLRRLSGGASQQTWAFDVVCAAGQRSPFVLRRAADAQGERARGTAGLTTEASLILAALAGGVPVPVVRHVLEPGDGAGEGFVMERIEGETLGRRIVRDPGLASAREALARQCAEALARIHRLPVLRLPPLRSAGARGELDFQIDLHRAHGTIRPVFELAFHWLREHAPADPNVPVLVHGDFRNGNLMVGQDGLRAVLDWELAHLGDPMEDLGWMCVRSWRFGRSSLPVGGFGTREQLFAAYEAAGGVVDEARVRWWEALGTLKWGIVCESMAHAWLSGRERNVEKAAIGRRASEAEFDLLALISGKELT